ncbi:MAG: UDP-glucose dehydrogenase family protein [Pseudoclavibacter sp.]
MRLSVIGCGYLGAVHSAGMASLGHEVVGIDVDERKVDALTRGEAPFFEPGLPELLREQVESGRLTFSTDLELARGARVHFVGVGTPQQQGSDAADMTYVNAAVDGLAGIVGPGEIVVGKSTVPVGTASRLLGRIVAAQPEASLAWNPEFLREGFAVKDTLHPDRLVYGVRGGTPADDAAGARDAAVLDEVYAQILADDTPRLVTDLATSELVKVSANAFLATKISFINAMAEICEQTGADVTMLADAIGMDPRIGRRFLNSGIGFGGGCLPKDIRAFQARATELGVGESLHFLREVDGVNLRRRARVVELVREMAGPASADGRLDGVTVALLGLAFKPNSDDTRDSPALDVARQLIDLGASVRGYDPEAMSNASRVVPELQVAESPADAVRGADIVVVATEWQHFRDLDPAEPGLRDAVAAPRVIDARNCLDHAAWRAAGWTLRALGRGAE